MNYRIAIVALVCLAAFVVGCAPSAKNEIQYWENAKKDFAEAVSSYPAFKDVLTAKMTEAQKLWDDAQKATGEEQAKQMKAANDKLNELLGLFAQIKSKIKGVEESIAKLNAKKLTKADDVVRVKAISAAKKAIGEVKDMLADAKATAEEEAKKIVNDAIGKLISAQGDIDRAIKSLEPKKASEPVKKKK